MCLSASVSASLPVAVLLGVALAALATPTSAWVASPQIGDPSLSPAGPNPVAVDAPVSLAWPVAPIAPPAEGCGALSVIKVVAVVLGALAALKLPLLLAKVMLAKVLLLLPLALPLALPLLVPFMMVASMLPFPGFGMDESPASDSAAPASPVTPAGGGAAPGGGNASPVTPGGDEMEARGAWVESCVQRVACQLNTRGSRKECARFRCAAIDWLGGS